MKKLIVIDVEENGEYYADVYRIDDDDRFVGRYYPKPMPERQKVKAGAGGYTRGFTAGYNKLRYLIVGADEEIDK